MKIPPGTKHFAFLYPVEAAATAALNILLPMESLMVNGGFVYFDATCRVLGINVICTTGSAGILNFDGPFELGREAQRELKSQGRMQAVTIPFLLRCSARSFAWIHPGEFGAGVGRVTAEYGAFAYTSTANGGGEGIYFPMKIKQKQTARRFSGGCGQGTPGFLRSKHSAAALDFLRSGSPELGGGGGEEDRRRRQAALWMASGDGDAETCCKALQEGAEVDRQDEDGHTALSHAAEGGHSSLVKMLVQRGANVWLQANDDGHTA